MILMSDSGIPRDQSQTKEKVLCMLESKISSFQMNQSELD